jgi:hypothetical protein
VIDDPRSCRFDPETVRCKDAAAASGPEVEAAKKIYEGLKNPRTGEQIFPGLEFFAHGGKLILYHGWADPLIAPRNTIDYYKSVVTRNGAGAENSVRLFMAPGMDHCGGAPAPGHRSLTWEPC